MNDSNEQLSEDQNNPENERIGFGRRLGAYMLDTLVIMILGSIVGVLFGDSLVSLFFGDQIAEMEQVSEQLSGQLGDKFSVMIEKTMEISAGISVTGLILFFMEGAFGQSFGKMLLKIINTNVDGTPASAGKLWLRSFLKYGSSILSLIGGVTALAFIGTIASIMGFIIFIGFFFVFADKKQTLHDIIAKTVVSRK